MHGAQLGFSAAARELETWLLGCQQRLAAQARRAPTRADAAWRREYDVIEEVRCRPRLQPILRGSWYDSCNVQTISRQAASVGVVAF